MVFFIEAGTEKTCFCTKWLAQPEKCIFPENLAFSCRVMIFTTRKTAPSSTAPFSGFRPPYSPLLIEVHHWWLSISHGDKLFWQRVFYQIDAKVSTAFNERDVSNVLLTYTNFCETYSCLNDIISIQDSAILTLQTNRRLRFYTNSIEKSSKICVISSSDMWMMVACHKW